MDNYKIKDEAESKEAQELFVQLGFEKTGFSCNGYPCYLATWECGFSDCDLDSLNVNRERKELTLPQLRDLVVLKRNDVKDANVEDGTGFPLYLSSTNELYVNDCEWKLSKKNGDLDYICKLKLIHRPQDSALISGAEALRALADGKDVDVHESTYKNEVWFNLKDTKFTPAEILAEKVRDKPYTLTFRLKPQTIKLELELAKPFEPKNGEMYWWIDATSEEGYSYTYFDNNKVDQDVMQFGAFRTEEDVKKAVEQLRKIRGTNS
ncbi:hypothetical protein [Acinetobacter pittii]|uniref:hypothetical protein n=1 Tax=Acinetobacter pittii TaxID=48296 RepID=UPI000707656A|nr:hypothetical protein [Acinetobacter pittii]KQE43914.1 hypothetical protein APD46_06765 [Acinetobacter pittii]KRJ48296.1 hypothetical protein APC88_04320 [Acinetobacter pittii]MCU4428791.1 hypothetical protein [Acinetobacter pittii]OTN35913.1 hypothetical protein B9Y11_18030 [Acinetobacter pittii]